MKAAIAWSLLLLAGSATCTPVEVKSNLPDWFPDLSEIEKPSWWPDSIPDLSEIQKPDWWPDSIPDLSEIQKPDWWPDSIPDLSELEKPDWWPDSFPDLSELEKPDWWPDSFPDLSELEKPDWWPDSIPDWFPDIEWPVIDWDAIPRPEINRAVPGTPASIEEYPGIVQIEVGTGVIWAQGGVATILTSGHVITSARVVSGRLFDIRMRRVRAGSSSRNADGVIIDVASVITHPSYGDTLENFFYSDIAIVRLGSFLTFGPTIQQSPIVSAGFNLAGGLPIKHVGWGSTAQGRKISDRDLYSIDLVSVENSACSDLWSRFIPVGSTIKVSSDKICAAVPETGGRDTDFRDIGAPLFADNILVGIVSWGNPLGNQQFPLVATAVSAHTDWIVQNAV